MKSTTVISHFWKWFAQYAEEYRAMHTHKKKKMNYLLNDLDMHLRAYCRYLQAVICLHNTTGEGTLIVTANGRERYFGRADKLVAAAPALLHWHVQALHPPSPPDCLLDVLFPDASINTDRLWFSVLCDEGNGCPKDIIVYSELYGPEMDDSFASAVRLVIYNLLGERMSSLYIREVHLANISEAPYMEDVMRLEELPAYINENLAYMEPAGAFEVSASGELRQRRL